MFLTFGFRVYYCQFGISIVAGITQYLTFDKEKNKMIFVDYHSDTIQLYRWINLKSAEIFYPFPLYNYQLFCLPIYVIERRDRLYNLLLFEVMLWLNLMCQICFHLLHIFPLS